MEGLYRMECGKDNKEESLIISEAQLILAEKRTSLAMLRTGIAVFVLPLSVVSFLVATSGHYSFIQNLHFILPILILSLALVLLGSYLIVHAMIRIHRQDKLLTKLKESRSSSAKLLD